MLLNAQVGIALWLANSAQREFQVLVAMITDAATINGGLERMCALLLSTRLH